MKPTPSSPRRWRDRRERANLTQEEVAIRAGLSLSDVKAFELGRSEPTPAQALAVEAVLRDGPAKP